MRALVPPQLPSYSPLAVIPAADTCLLLITCSCIYIQAILSSLSSPAAAPQIVPAGCELTAGHSIASTPYAAVSLGSWLALSACVMVCHTSAQRRAPDCILYFPEKHDYRSKDARMHQCSLKAGGICPLWSHSTPGSAAALTAQAPFAISTVAPRFPCKFSLGNAD